MASTKAWHEHPLTVLVMAALGSTVLWPLVSERNEQARQLYEARLAKCLEIMRNVTETNEHLNAMLTLLDIYRKDNAGNPRWQPAQVQARQAMMERYLEFDRQAWWWHSRLPLESEVLRTAVSEEELRAQLDSYEAALLDATSELDRYWEAALRQETAPSAEELTRIAAQVRSRLRTLQGSRWDTAGKIVSLFRPEPASLWRSIRDTVLTLF